MNVRMRILHDAKVVPEEPLKRLPTSEPPTLKVPLQG
jgi:hypothetical protein